MPTLLAELFPLLYGICFLVLLWQAFRVMGRGFRAMQRPEGLASSQPQENRLGKLTIHPELLDADGKSPRRSYLPCAFPMTMANPFALWSS